MNKTKNINNNTNTDNNFIQLGGAAAHPDVYEDSTTPFDATILRIYNTGVDNIVRQIKDALKTDPHQGPGKKENNLKAKAIIQALKGLGAQITPIITNINANKLIKNSLDNIDPIEANHEGIIHNYNDNSINGDLDVDDYARKPALIINPASPANTPITDSRKRLHNCQILEVLYLSKHQELIKTLNFTIELYGKYKYIMTILLYILKNLITAQAPVVPGGPAGPTGTPVAPGATGGPAVAPADLKIQLPKPIIRNIKALVDEQQEISGLIDRMNQVVRDNGAGDFPYKEDLVNLRNGISYTATP